MLLVEATISCGKAVIRGVGVVFANGLIVLSMWSESTSGSCM